MPCRAPLSVAISSLLGLAVLGSPTTTASAGVVSTPQAAAQSSASTTAELAAQIRAELKGSTAGSVAYRVNIKDVGHVSRNWKRHTAPASNQKLFTALTSLERLGTDFRFRTVVATAGTVDGRVLRGNLVIRGSGDPTLRKRGLRSLARELHDDGLRRVTGHLVVDDSRYTGRTRAPGWKDGWVGEETGPVAAFTVGKNAWRGGSDFLRDPAPYNGRLWRRVLAEENITVEDSTVVRRADRARKRLAAHRSKPLATIWQQALPESDNFTAEMLLREIGADRGQGSRRGGLRAIRKQGRVLELPLGDVVDGSGLSPRNDESPRVFVHWLRAARKLDSFDALYAALPVSCEDGTTLEDRMCGPRVAGRVHAKTGTLNHVRTLSGYTRTRSGHRVTFSFMLAQVSDLTAAREHLDAAVATVVRSEVD